MKPARRRQLVDNARSTWNKVSIRRDCSALVTVPSTCRYKSRRAGQAILCNRMKEIAATRVRYGYRRIHVLLRQEGCGVNAKRVYRLYCEMGLQLGNKSPRRRVKARLRDDRRPATRQRPHSVIGNMTPVEAMKRSAAHGPPLLASAENAPAT